MPPFAEMIGTLDEIVPGPLYQQLERKMREAILQKKLQSQIEVR